MTVKSLQFEDGRMTHASKYGQAEEKIDIVLTEEEKVIEASIKVCISDISIVFQFSSCNIAGYLVQHPQL